MPMPAPRSATPPRKGLPRLRTPSRRSGLPAAGAFHHQSGIALFVVLWVMILLAAIAGQFHFSVRHEFKALRNLKESAEAYYIAEAGLALATLSLLNDSGQPTAAEAEAQGAAWRANAPVPVVAYAGGRIGIWIDNEAGRVNLNTADAPLLRLMLGGLSLDESQMDTIVDSILDWRDPDEFHRASGAESRYYLSLPQPYTSKNADFDRLEELQWVKGVTPDLYRHLQERFTVFHDSAAQVRQLRALFRRRSDAGFGRINLNAAPPAVLMALPGMTEERVAALAELRQERDVKSLTEVADLLGAGVFAEMAPYVTLEMSPFYVIHVEGMVNQSAVRQRIALKIRVDPLAPNGFTVIQRIEG